MLKHGEISTEVGKAPFVFSLASFVCTTTAALLMLIKGRGNMLAIMSAFMLIIVALASLGVLIGLLTDYAYIKDDVLYMRYVFKKSSISLKDIGKIQLKDNVYHVYNLKNDEIGTVNAVALGIESITSELYRKHVPFI
ncbi:MAG: hypothetical protein IJJ00_05560 [Erysipelotrichaceae bacterium]|nr:hypothetical protein [Erysipelotrichaceae bacterium]